MATTKRTGERESSFCNRTQSENLLSAIFCQKQQRRFCDVLIKVCGREIGAHSNVLAAVSPYFAAFFGQDLPRCFSQKCPQLIEIQIDGFTGPNAVYETAVDSVITYAYTGVIWISESSVTQVLEIARTMQLDDVVLFCEDFISNHKVSGNQFMKLSDIVQSSGEEESNAVFADKVKTEETAPHRSFLSNTSNVYQGLGCGGSSRSRSVKMNSVSTQVRPALLGMQSCLGETKDQSTSTDVRLFWNFEKHRRVGKRKLKPIGSSFDGDADSTLNENEHSVNLLAFDPADCTDCNSVKNDGNSLQTQFTTRSENSDLSIGNKDIRKVSNMVQDVCDRQQLLKIRYSSRIRRRPLKLLDGEVDLEHNIKLSNKNVDILEAVYHEQSSDELQEEVMQQNESNVNNNILPSEIALDSGNSIDLLKLSAAKEKKKLRFPSRASEWKKFCCDLCAFSTNNVRSMSAHNKLHKMLDNVCYYCELKFQDRRSTELHMLEHTSQTMPFFCRFCHQHFQSRTQLMLHLPKHSDEKPYICEVCSIGFKWKNALKNHMITHENRKEHLCDICGYATAHRCQLKAHRLVHTGETMQCPHDGCNYHATKAQNLKYHMLTHTQVKAHQCEVCGTSFSLVKNLKRHMLLHTSQKSHKCECCEFASTRYDKLKEHLHKQHSIGTAPEKRLRITDMVYQSRIFENTSSQRSSNNDSAEFKPSPGVDPVVESSDLKSDLEVFYSDDYQMLELADGFRVDNVKDVKDAICIFPNQTIIIAHANDVNDLAIQTQLPGVTLMPVVSLANNALGDSSGEVNPSESVILDCIEHAVDEVDHYTCE